MYFYLDRHGIWNISLITKFMQNAAGFGSDVNQVYEDANNHENLEDLCRSHLVRADVVFSII